MENKEPAEAAIEVFIEFYADLLAKQEELPAEFKKILDENIEDLYER